MWNQTARRCHQTRKTPCFFPLCILLNPFIVSQGRANDYTTNNAAEGGNALFAGCVYGSLGELYLFCYANESGDSLKQHREQDVVTYYMNAGATDVRLRTFGGRRFICYRATVDREDGEETWDTYETWDGDIQLTFETRMSPGDVLPILATIAFTPIAQEN